MDIGFVIVIYLIYLSSFVVSWLIFWTVGWYKILFKRQVFIILFVLIYQCFKFLINIIVYLMC